MPTLCQRCNCKHKDGICPHTLRAIPDEDGDDDPDAGIDEEFELDPLLKKQPAKKPIPRPRRKKHGS